VVKVGKVLTDSERKALDWLTKKYGKIMFNYNKSPDFILPDGRGIEVKRPAFNTIYFTAKQWFELSGDTEIMLMGDGSEPIAIVPFSEVKKAYESGKQLKCGGKNYRISVPEKQSILVIRCSEETWRAFRRYAVDYEGYEAALRSLLVKAGLLSESAVF
jgi:hypothetical protein